MSAPAIHTLGEPACVRRAARAVGLEEVARHYLDPGDDAELALAMEFVLEGLLQENLIAKEHRTAVTAIWTCSPRCSISLHRRAAARSCGKVRQP